MTWDATIPEDDDLINAGPGVIRTMKTDLATALTAQGSFPGADTANPKYKWTPEYGNTAARPSTSLVSGQLYINTQTGSIQRYNGATWDDILSVADGAITSAKLAAAVAGDGLAGGAGTALSVNVGTGLEISSDAVRIAAAAAGNGLSGGAGSALAVNVDDSTIEINSDSLRVKDGGITLAKLATEVTNKLSPKSIQQISANITLNLSGTDEQSGSSSVTITSVTTSKAYVILNGHKVLNATLGGASGLLAVGARATLASSTSVTLEASAVRDATDGGTRTIDVTIYATVVEWN